jgi:hypothetical protein
MELKNRIGKAGGVDVLVLPDDSRGCSDQQLGQARVDMDRIAEALNAYRHTLPVRLGCVGCSFQFGRTSMLLPRLPHLAQTTRGRNDGTLVSAG